MVEYDMKRVRRLQRNIDEAKRKRRVVKLAITALVLIELLLIGMVIAGNVLQISWIGNFGFVLIPLNIFLLFGVPCLAVETDTFDCFSEVRQAEYKLEDYYDEVDTP